MTDPTVHPAWTDADLDAALRDLAGVVDPESVDVSLIAVRARLTGAATAPPVATTAEVLDLGPVRTSRSARRRWAPALLVAAALVAAVALTAVLWPRSGVDRSAPPGVPTTPVVSPVERTRQQLALLVDPVPIGEPAPTVLFATSGTGDALLGGAFSVASPTASGRPVTLTYSFVCGNPRRGDSVEPSGEPDYVVTDNLGTTGSGTCFGIAGGTHVGGFGSYSPPTVEGRTGVRITVPNPDVVWKLVVSTSVG